jgi:steroid 5-alpha reductase family enzyme
VTAFAAGPAGLALLAGALAAVAWAVTAWWLGRRTGRVNIIDTLWGPGFGLIAVLTLVIAQASGTGNSLRQGLLTALVLSWGGRLGWHVGRRSAGQGEDPRYAKLLERPGGQLRVWRRVYLPQLAALFIVSLPVQVAMFTGPAAGLTDGLGAAISVTGIVFESVGDRQLRRFKSDLAHHGQIMDTGLWRYTRHPNYFGDACFWTGVYVIAAGHWPGAFTIVSPVLMTCLLAFGTGKRLLERSMAGRPGYAEYLRRTSGFIPLPPR